MKWRRPGRFLLGLGILVVGVLALPLMMALRPKAERVQPPPRKPWVEVSTPVPLEGRLTVRGSGTVRPLRETELSAEVAGRVIQVCDRWVRGGAVRKGDLLVKIDPTDYVNALEVARAEVVQREYELLLAREDSIAAQATWERIKLTTGQSVEVRTSELGKLVFKEPQVRLAEARLVASEARRDEAEAHLSRTEVRSPFDSRVREKFADMGQFVAAGQALATLYSVDLVEIEVALTSSEAALIDGLWVNVEERARIPARVFATLNGGRHQWAGYVHRVLGQVDEETRTVRAVVRVPEPYHSTEGSSVPLLVGAFATVEIAGRSLAGTLGVPIEALRDDDSVWVVRGDRLRVQSIRLLQKRDGRAVVLDGLGVSDLVVTSSLPTASDGMAVELRSVED